MSLSQIDNQSSSASGLDAGTDNIRQLDFFAGIGKAISSARTLREVLKAVMGEIAGFFAPSNWSVLLRNHATGDLVFVLVTGQGVESLQGQVLKRGRGIAGWIAENGEPLIITDAQNDPRFDSSMDAATGFTTSTIIGVPLKTRTRVFGVIELVNKLNGKPFSAYELKVLMTIADFAAIAIEKIYYMRTLRRFALTDSLTGLPNRRLLVPFIEREVERSKRDQQAFSVMFVDIDDFKNINDRYGHHTGDLVLKAVANVVRSQVRSSDHVCRWGGDEFVVVLSARSSQEAALVRRRILADPRLATALNGHEVQLSIGIHEAVEGDAESILREVDRDMYQSKMLGLENHVEDMPTALEDTLNDER